MMQFGRFLPILFVVGIFIISADAVRAQQPVPTKDTRAITRGQEGGKPAPKIEPGDNFQPVEKNWSDVLSKPAPRIEPGDNFQPRPGERIHRDDASPGRK